MTVSRILSLSLTNYRSFPSATFSFDPAQTLIIGPNGRGKTNILEAIALLSTGRSFRGKSLSECVRLGSDVAHVNLKAHADDEDVELSAAIVAKVNNLGERSSVKYKKNNVAKRKSDVIGQIKSVMFRPEDLDIITGSPSHKRDFLDDVLMQVDPKYVTAHREYEKALRHRNKLILQLRDGEASRGDFYFWDQLLLKHSDVITRERSRFVHFINTYVPFPIQGEVVYDHSIMSQERLHKYAVAEVAAGKTLVGPHRDGLYIHMKLNGGGELSDVASFGSRGQQRLAVLWLKLAQLAFIEQETSIVPVLLLDDIFSELDDHNREIIFSLFKGRQVIMTSAEQLDVLPKECQSGKLITL